MKRCYEVEWFERITGRREHNHCGRSHKIGDFWYCIKDGKIEGYGMTCANIASVPSNDTEQLSLFGDPKT